MTRQEQNKVMSENMQAKQAKHRQYGIIGYESTESNADKEVKVKRHVVGTTSAYYLNDSSYTGIVETKEK